MKKYLIYLLIQTFYISQQAHNDIQINISSLDSPLQEIHWCGDDSSNDQGVVLLTTKGSVYTSDNRGISWQKKVEQFIKEGINAQQNLNEDIGYVHKIMSSPINSNEIVFIGTQGINWITTDCGQTIKPLGANMNLKEFAFHPTERTWMLASSWSVCDNKNENQSKNNQKNQCFVTKDLYLSQNFGQKWKLLTKYIVQFQWAQRFQNIQSKIPIQRIIYSKEIGNQGHQKIQGWNMKTHLFYSDDFLVKEQNMIVNQGNKFLITENYIFAAQVHNSQTQEVKLMVAQQNLQNEQNYKFNYVEIDQNIFQHSFTVLDTSEGQVFLNLNPYGYNSPLGIIYQSDSTGRRFSLSLQDNVRSTDGQCDFEKLFSVDGIYIANIYQGKKIEELKKSLLQKNPDSSNFDIPLESSINKKSQQQKISDINTQDLQKYIQTRITFNKGGNWSRIKPPQKDSQGQNTECDINKGCSLHLHSISSKMEFGPVYSSENSIGLIIGTGNIGTYLQHKANKTNTYLSRDGGLSWIEIKKGSHIYEVADHGALILIAPNQYPSDSVYYSWDEGLTWTQLKISSKQINIQNIITEPGNTSDKFIIYGELEDEQLEENKGVVILVDLTQLHPRVCQGFDSPSENDQESDYEYWIPHNPGEGCLLGKEMKFVRRKRYASCYNPENFERPISVRKCECTEYDWECDLGYERVISENQYQCVQIKGYIEVDEECQDYYYIPNGYRKITGNQCEGGVSHEQQKISCFWVKAFRKNGVLYNIGILGVLIGLILIIVKYQNFVLYVLVKLKVVKFVDYLQDLIVRMLKKQNQEYIGIEQIEDENGKKQFQDVDMNIKKRKTDDEDEINRLV